MCEVNKHIADAFRYLRISARELYEHTPAEYLAMRNGSIEGIYDEMERYANLAIMIGNAVNAQKRIKSSDLFKRPTETVKTEKTAEDLKREEDETMAWLSQFTLFADKYENTKRGGG